MNEFLEQFVVEARELVEQATSDLLALEHAPSDRESLDSVFRAFHTLKGGAAIVDFELMSRAMHAAEDVLSSVRTGNRPVTNALVGDCLSCLDSVVRWLDSIEESNGIPRDADADAERILARFAAYDETANAPEAGLEASTPALASSVSPRAILKEQLLILALKGEGSEGRIASAARLATNVLRSLGRIEESGRIDQALLQYRETGDASALIRLIEQAVMTPPLGAGPAAPGPRADPLSRTLRVDAERVNALVNLTGELTVAKNAVGHIAKLARDSNNPLAVSLRDEHARLDRLIAALQRAVLSLRVFPLRNVFQRFSRLVREMSETLAKPVRLITEGDETEADKAIVEMLFEPLLHAVRNALDHGIESGPERLAANKPAVATIHLRARAEGEHVVIEIEDDGRGIAAARIRKTALERGLVSSDALAALSDEEAIDLIFRPGFSTAEEITGLSGRGVGMDAVRTAVERFGGRVLIETRPGQGSKVSFILPFSVMMTRVMTVEAGGQMFGIPLDAVVETVRLPRGHIHAVGGAHAFVLRDQTIPLIALGRTLGQISDASSPSADATIVVTWSGGQSGGLEVDRLGERMDVMLKPPSGLIAGMPGIAGTTLLGDGSVLLVLDIHEVLS